MSEITTSPSQSLVEAEAPTYWAFISYSHLDNAEQGRRWANWLHQALEQYDIPTDLEGATTRSGDTIPSQLYPVFRDEAELSASSDLTEQLREALRESRHLVVICSPHALKSRHVANEITYFKSLGRADRIHAIIIDGSPNATDSDDPDEWSDECFPPPLRYRVDEHGTLTSEPQEPFAADLRTHATFSDGSQGWTTAEAYRDFLKRNHRDLSSGRINEAADQYRQTLDTGLLKVISGILEVPLRDLTERDKAYQLEKSRKRERIVALVAGFMTLLFLLAVVAGGFAIKKQMEARVAEGKALLNQATGHLNQSEYPQTQMAAARALGFDQFSGGDTRRPFWKFWADGDYPNSLIPNNNKGAPLVKRLDQIASGKASASLAPLPVWCSEPIPMPENHKENPSWGVVFSPDYQWVASADEDGRVRIYSWTDDEHSPAFLPNPGRDHWAARDLDLSKDGDWLAVMYQKPREGVDFVGIWQVDRSETGNPKFELYHTFDYPRGRKLAWSPDATRLVVVGGAMYSDGKIAVWSREGKPEYPDIERFIPGQWQWDVAWSPSGDTITTVGHKEALLLETTYLEQIGLPLHRLAGDSAFTSVAYSEHGHLIAAGTTNRQLYIWRREATGYELVVNQLAHTYPIQDTAFSPGGKTLLTATDDGTVKIWDTTNLPVVKLSATLLADSSKLEDKFPSIRAITTSPDGDFVLTGLFDASLRMWSLGRQEVITEAGEGNVESLSLARERRLLASAREFATEVGGYAARLKVTDLVNERTLWETELELPKRSGFALRLNTHFIQEESRLLVFCRPLDASSDCLFLYDALTGELLDATRPDGDMGIARSAAFSMSGARIVWADAGAQMYAAWWDPASDKLPKPDSFSAIEDCVEGLDKSIQVWDLKVSPDGRKAVMVGRHKVGYDLFSYVHIADLEKGRTTVHTEVGRNAAMCADFSPDGRRVAVGTYDKRLIYILDTKNGERVGDPLRGHEFGVTTVKYSPDGKELASGSLKQIRLWDSTTHGAISVFDAHEKMIQAIEWDPTVADDVPPLLISGAEDQTMKVWTLPNSRPDLRAYDRGKKEGAAPWLVFNDKRGILEWNTDDDPHSGWINLASHSTIGRLLDDPGSPRTNWGLYRDSAASENWDSAASLHANLTPDQAQRNSPVVSQAARATIEELRLLNALPNPPSAYISRQAGRLRRLLPEGSPIRQELEEF